MPFGIVADVVDILERDHDGDGPGEQAVAAIGGAFLSVVKQLGQKTYLTSINDTLAALLSPERNLEKGRGQDRSQLRALRLRAALREPGPADARDPGYRGQHHGDRAGSVGEAAAKRDLFGDPLTVNNGLWVTGKTGFVDAEVRRMIDEAGVGPFRPAERYAGRGSTFGT